jgi:hypothetical protein
MASSGDVTSREAFAATNGGGGGVCDVAFASSPSPLPPPRNECTLDDESPPPGPNDDAIDGGGDDGSADRYHDDDDDDGRRPTADDDRPCATPPRRQRRLWRRSGSGGGGGSDDDDDDDDDDVDEGDGGATTASPPPDESTTTTNDDYPCRRTNDAHPALRRRAMEVSVALEALESMRRFNLELEFVNAIAAAATTTTTTGTASFPVSVRHDRCTFCQREALRRRVVASSGGGVAAASVARDDGGEAAARRPDGGGDGRVRRFNGGIGGAFFSKRNARDDDGNGDCGDDGKTEPIVVKEFFPGESRRRRFHRGVDGFFSRRDAEDDSGGDDGKSEPVAVKDANGYDGQSKPVVVKDDNVKRPDRNSRIIIFNGDVGGFFSKRHAEDDSGDDGKLEPVAVRDENTNVDDGTSQPVVVKDENSKWPNGSRIRRFNTNVGSFFSRNKAGDDGKFAEATAQFRVNGDIGGFVSENIAGNDKSDDGEPDEETAKSDLGNADGKSGSVYSDFFGDSNDEGSDKVDDDKAKLDSFNTNVGSVISKNSDVNDDCKSQLTRHNIMAKISPCLTCGHPTCPRHSSSAFSRKNIPMCQTCAYLFELDFIVDIIASAASSSDFVECRRRVNEMVDCYDRAKLLLSYMVVYAEDVALALEAQAARSNKIGAGSGATSIVSSIAGIVGCGVLLFVGHGVPLLIASLVVSGGATAAQTGDEMARYYSEPNRLAERMVALHGMATSLLRVKNVLSHVLLKGHHLSDGEFPEAEDDEGSTRRAELAREIKALLDKHTVNGGVGNTAARNGSKFVGRGTRYFGRVCSTAAVIPVAGGLLSAATIYFEGNELKRTLSRISEGNPCAKAEQVRLIGDDLDMLPDSSLVLEECCLVFELAQKEKTTQAPSAPSIYLES